MSTPKNILIAGAGLVGSLLAIYLKKRGHEVTVYERRGDMRAESVEAGRSINLAVSTRGFRALAGAGLEEEVKRMSMPMHGRMIHQEDGRVGFQAYGRKGQSIYSVSRGGLNVLLLNAAEQAGVKFHFESRCKDVDLERMALVLEDGSRAGGDLIFGADGAFSSVRTGLMKSDRFDYSQEFLDHSYKELSVPAGKDGAWQLEKNALHIWPRHRFMLIALPNLDGSFTCTLFAPFRGDDSFESIRDDEELNAYFGKYFGDVAPKMNSLGEDFFRNPTSSLVTIKCAPWICEDRIVLIGDAAHAIVPFYGQGMNAGFEDITVLDEMMDRHEDDWPAILREYERERKPNADAIAWLAIENFLEMRDKVADEHFLLQKKISQRLQDAHPDRFSAVYSLVTFSNRPYTEASDQMLRQERFFQELRRREMLADSEDQAYLDDLIRIWENGFDAPS